MRRSQSQLLLATQFLDLVPRHAGQKRRSKKREREEVKMGASGGGGKQDG